MARLAACALITGLFACASGAGLHFINPPPYNTADNVSNYPKYKKGDSVAVSWTPGDKFANISLSLVQADVYDLMYPEWLLENVMESTQFQWVVGTGRNLTDSNLFSFNVYQGSTELSTKGANSQYFFIEEDNGQESDFALSVSSAVSPIPTSAGASAAVSSSASESTLTSTPYSTVPTQYSTRTSTPAGSNAPRIETTAPTLPDQNIIHDGFSFAAKIGIGVGITVAIILGLLAGWLLFHRRKRDTVAHELPTSAPDQLEFNTGSYHRTKSMHEAPGPDIQEAPIAYIHEAPPNQLVEMGQSEKQDLGKWSDGGLDDVVSEGIPGEMDDGALVEEHEGSRRDRQMA